MEGRRWARKVSSCSGIGSAVGSRGVSSHLKLKCPPTSQRGAGGRWEICIIEVGSRCRYAL